MIIVGPFQLNYSIVKVILFVFHFLCFLMSLLSLVFPYVPFIDSSLYFSHFLLALKSLKKQSYK